MSTKLRLTIDVEYEGDVSKARLSQQLTYAAGHLSGNGMLSDAASEVKSWDCKVTETPPENTQTLNLSLSVREDLVSVLEYVTENEQHHYEECAEDDNAGCPDHVYAKASRVQQALIDSGHAARPTTSDPNAPF